MPGEVSGQFGGRVTFTFDGITIPPCDGDFIIDPSLFEVAAEANQDGSSSYRMKPKLPGAEIKLRNVGDVDWNAILLRIGNCTIVEQTNGRTHLFTATRLVGSAKVNVSSGEVDGLSIMGGTYQRLNNS